MAQNRPGISPCCWRPPRSLKRHRISHARTLAQEAKDEMEAHIVGTVALIHAEAQSASARDGTEGS